MNFVSLQLLLFAEARERGEVRKVEELGSVDACRKSSLSVFHPAKKKNN